MFGRVLIANRGAIACRIARTLRRLGVSPIAVYTRADRDSLHVDAADQAVQIGEGPAAESYLSIERILEAARSSGAEAIHPGYGFLSENPELAEACAADARVFIGPTPEQMRDFGLKHTARELARAAGVPLLPGTALLEDLDNAREQARHIGYPLMLKSSAGGGGIGMQLCREEAELAAAFSAVQRLGESHFRNAGVFLEKYVGYARHIEVQIFGDGHGGVLALGERDCSIQRRNQKVIEETPAPNLPDEVRAGMRDCALALAESVRYRSAGTVEFVYDAEDEKFYFLEVNTRLQVEHGVTEERYGIDLVEWMVRLAAGELPPLAQLESSLDPRGHSIEARVYAEDPAKGFQPCAGLLTHTRFPRGEGIRLETWVEGGLTVSAFYDPMLAKLIVHGRDRPAALLALTQALRETEIGGIETNLEHLRTIAEHGVFQHGRQYTRLLDGLAYAPASIDVLDGGTQSTVQDYPGRRGYWAVGVPPSGPMDDLSFRIGNRLLGNPEGAAGLELTLKGPTLRFNRASVIALTGARMGAELDGEPVPFWEPVPVPAGGVLRMDAIEGAGARAYLSVRGGLEAPSYLGSRATFTLGGFGGHGGRALRAGDVLHLAPDPLTPPGRIPEGLRPPIGTHWELRVLYGPHGAPDFFTESGIDTFFASDWEVHYHSSRTGIRLIGPRPEWARKDGGEAGLHPSNIHDNAYAIGTVDFTGDMPVILGPDGPSLGGFVCPATTVRAERWKLGQLRAGDRVRFVPISLEDARALEQAQEQAIAALAPLEVEPPAATRSPAVLRRVERADPDAALTYRACGDDYLLIELGPQVLDIGLRARVHALMGWLEAKALPGVIDLTPGIRSLQVHYDPGVLPLERLMRTLGAAEGELGAADDLEVPSRIVHLPLSWDDPSTRLAIDRYMHSVRPDAPWCPSNLEFIRRINGLDSIEEVRRIVFEASYLVLGLGDVYLGAPVATPIDPRHRLVTTKYNPARTWTPENAVGIGGAYLCVYGMEGPGGYQFVGRTLQMWNRYRQSAEFPPGRPWLLRFFDQIRFFPVSSEELEALREEFPRGRYRLEIEETRFRLREHRALLAAHAGEIGRFRERQARAFAEERQRWELEQVRTALAAPEQVLEERGEEEPLPPDAVAVDSTVTGSVWRVLVAAGERVQAGQELVIVESMKMEIAITAPHAGTVRELLCGAGSQVSPGRRLLVISQD